MPCENKSSRKRVRVLHSRCRSSLFLSQPRSLSSFRRSFNDQRTFRNGRFWLAAGIRAFELLSGHRSLLHWRPFRETELPEIITDLCSHEASAGARPALVCKEILRGKNKSVLVSYFTFSLPIVGVSSGVASRKLLSLVPEAYRNP